MGLERGSGEKRSGEGEEEGRKNTERDVMMKGERKKEKVKGEAGIGDQRERGGMKRGEWEVRGARKGKGT